MADAQAALASLLVPVFGSATAAWCSQGPREASVYAAFARLLGGVPLAL
jgi:hypothetical protein